jgi:hypothetical protein
MSDEFSHALYAVLSAVMQEATAPFDAQAADLAPAIRSFVDQGPSRFRDAVLFPWDEFLGSAIRQAFPHVPPDRLNALTFLFRHADFVIPHLRQQFERVEGRACSFDKTLWILHYYTQWLISGDAMPVISDPRQFFHPKSMTVAFWLGFCDHLQGLYYGCPEAYLADLTQLAAAGDS